MRVRSANFVTSCADPKAADSYSPHIAVAGRSNCGKSSLLNMLMGARLCKTSQTPGRTRLINVFRVNADAPFYFIDLPGYGFNAAQRATSDELNARTDAYFRGNDNIAQVLCLMDVRRDPSDLDKVLINYLRDLCLPFTVVITKADKLSKAQLGNAKLRRRFGSCPRRPDSYEFEQEYRQGRASGQTAKRARSVRLGRRERRRA